MVHAANPGGSAARPRRSR
jgi:hypothetical protein